MTAAKTISELNAKAEHLADAAGPPPTLAAALVEALKDLSVVDKNATADAGSYKYDYADIAEVVKLTRPKLAEHGIVALTPITEHTNGLACTVILLHSSGERLDLGPFPFPVGRDAQATGSMVTYHRRYALLAALGMAAGADDDDGATGKPHEPRDEPAGNVPPRRGGPPVCVVCGEEIVGKVKKHGNGWVHDPLCEKPADNPETEPF